MDETEDAMTQGSKLLYTVPEAADEMAIGRSKLYELIEAGMLETVRIGRARRIPAEALRNYVEGLRSEQRASTT
jgi:excisionase family DNA binding protein